MEIDIIGYLNGVINLTDDEKQAMLDDFCDRHGYTEQMSVQPNPVSKREYANKVIKNFIEDSVDSVRKRRAEAAATYDSITLVA